MQGSRPSQSPTDDAGFSVVEVIVAVGVVGVILMILTTGMASGLRGALVTKVQQTATGLGDEAVERARALTYDDLAMQTSDLDGDERIQNGTFDPDGPDGDLEPEPVATDPDGAVAPHVTTRTVGETPFTLSRYVTWVDANMQGGPAQDHKRITAIATWPVDDEIQTYRVSTLVANVVKGQSVEKFHLTSPATEEPVEASPGTEADVPAAVENLDVPETYDLTFDDLPSGWSETFYDDQGMLLHDSTGSSHPDTGEIGTAETFDLSVTLDIPSDAAPGDYMLPLRATAASDSAASKVASLQVRVTG